MMKLFWKSKMWDKVMEDPVCSSNTSFVLCWICLGILSKMVYHNQNILVTP